MDTDSMTIAELKSAAEACASEQGDRHIVVLDRGWIMVGNLKQLDDETWLISNAANLRKWSSGGFGLATKDPIGAGVVLDPCGDIRFREAIFTVPVGEGWAR